ncbi:site-specific DNA methylase [Paramecium bursaria Chlorella virus CVR-1]|uniref:Site-specific DNA methylase n=1 Tax=Paramecium bursaria Chlorella virus CVA-1 TaxID=42683 RepID=M1GYF0_9PHYC|nr:site-specific DNA methylase [Paramecium bursaria Chlorella virus CVA-1]AGE48978.1 site-specific DNA methylase [Paramecium bursaria Chlorella virus AP110A]AGE49998.1 site-specific DNA methylase [Paramecium bursaria Chlorella virus Can18-4]AGE50663.1 site-specific DNA methylase [Paramecium bursaria Chlorella virus CVA-1]AGE52341.1 site-specific DNA methylase [Paramecium bursaria Chlorella virus CVR-1]
MCEFSRNRYLGSHSLVILTTSENNPDASCSNPAPFPAIEKPVHGHPPVMMSTFPFHSVASKAHTSSNTGTSGCFFCKNSLASLFFSTYATGVTIPRRPYVIPPIPENKSRALNIIFYNTRFLKLLYEPIKI